VVDYKSHQYLIYPSAFLHTHPENTTSELSAEDWAFAAYRSTALHVLVHQDANRLVISSATTSRKYWETRSEIEKTRRINDLSPSQQKDFNVLVMPERAFLWGQKRLQAWEKRICEFLDIGLYCGKPGLHLERIA